MFVLESRCFKILDVQFTALSFAVTFGLAAWIQHKTLVNWILPKVLCWKRTILFIIPKEYFVTESLESKFAGFFS